MFTKGQVTILRVIKPVSVSFCLVRHDIYGLHKMSPLWPFCTCCLYLTPRSPACCFPLLCHTILGPPLLSLPPFKGLDRYYLISFHFIIYTRDFGSFELQFIIMSQNCNNLEPYILHYNIWKHHGRKVSKKYKCTTNFPSNDCPISLSIKTKLQTGI